MKTVGVSFKIDKNFDYTMLRGEIKKLARNVLKSVASTTANELGEVANFAILQFYQDYDPWVYNRHYYNFLNLSYTKYYLNRLNQNKYSAGIRFTPSNMRDLYDDDKLEVFQAVMFGGYHGYWSGADPMNPSPADIIYKARDHIVNNCQSYVNRAMDSIKGKDYGMLHIS